jgi:uncharacterized membrane protein YbaN (DUF454 family)
MIEAPETRTDRGKLSRWILAGAGSVCVGVGLVGIFVPGLPTTPLLLLAAFLFARSSPELHRKLLEHRVLGRYIRDYVEKGGLRPGVKWTAIALLWASIILAAWFSPWLWLDVALGVIALGVTVYIASLPICRT